MLCQYTRLRRRLPRCKAIFYQVDKDTWYDVSLGYEVGNIQLIPSLLRRDGSSIGVFGVWERTSLLGPSPRR